MHMAKPTLAIAYECLTQDTMIFDRIYLKPPAYFAMMFALFSLPPPLPLRRISKEPSMNDIE